MKNLKNLKKVIERLNAPKEYNYDGEIEICESSFNFKLEERNGELVLFDENENYYIDYLEECNQLMYDCSREFGFEFEPQSIDKIHEELEEAIKKDLGKESYLEWLDPVVMLIVGGSK